MRNTTILITVFFVGIAVGLLSAGLLSKNAVKDVDSATHAVKHLVPGYVCPMHPSVVSTDPGSCPICGMDLEPKTLDTMNDAAGGVAVSPAMSNSLGVRIAHVEKGRVSEQVFASGFVETVSPAQTTKVKAAFAGDVSKVAVEPGSWVTADDILLQVDSDEYAELQAAYLGALAADDYETVSSLRPRLVGMNTRQAVLDGIDRETGEPLPPHFQLAAPHSGEVVRIAEAGKEIEPGDTLLEIVAPTVARARLRTYARAARSVSPGRRAQLDLPHEPGLFLPGRVVEVNHDTGGFYTLIEADFEVPGGATHKGLFVGAYVNAGSIEDVLRIPASAVIRAEGESRVVRMRADGRFEPVVVATGFIGTEWAEVRSGLDEGDAVVVRAQFLIDSESTLRAGLSRMAGE
jgi:Cu(I)/Ag(I) efflux system membrane fusion protein